MTRPDDLRRATASRVEPPFVQVSRRRAPWRWFVLGVLALLMLAAAEALFLLWEGVWP